MLLLNTHTPISQRTVLLTLNKPKYIKRTIRRGKTWNSDTNVEWVQYERERERERERETINRGRDVRPKRGIKRY